MILLLRLLLAVGLVAGVQGCASNTERAKPGVDLPFKPAPKNNDASLLSKEDLALLEESENPLYRFGSGDRLSLQVLGRAEVSGKHVIGPDGMITVPLIGDVFLNGLTRDDAQKELDKRLREYFRNSYVTLSVEEYTSNQVTVLGRVATAGIQRFPHPPTLAEVLANAGALPILDKQATLTRCAIMRGREKLIWVDLKALLNGDLAYNIRMKKGDIVFIPDSSDTSVYVLGAVQKPGSYRLTPRMTVLDILAQAGGPNENAAPEKMGIYRSGTKKAELIEFSALIDPARRVNYALEDGDVLFVPTSGLADFGYFLRQISPVISILGFGLAVDSARKGNKRAEEASKRSDEASKRAEAASLEAAKRYQDSIDAAKTQVNASITGVAINPQTGAYDLTGASGSVSGSLEAIKNLITPP